MAPAVVGVTEVGLNDTVTRVVEGETVPDRVTATPVPDVKVSVTVAVVVTGVDKRLTVADVGLTERL